MQPSPTGYEAERAARIAANKLRMQELGIEDSLAALSQTITKPTPASQPRKRKNYSIDVPVRRSGRLLGTTPENLDEDQMFRKMGIDALDLLAPTRRRRNPVDPSAISAIRAKRMSKIDGEGDEDDDGRAGAHDSGLGVRIQGGRVYDSTYGVTCHWCRQKTLEQHVECTADGCGGGNRLPTSFCRMCLRNRHGEDVEQAIASKCWVCPGCRGSCGDGCTSCCNCGPCRKKAGLGPTHQLIKQARIAGFSNVHDFLVHRSTSESVEDIAARKITHPWGRWLTLPFTPGAADAEEETEKEAEKEQEVQNERDEGAATPVGDESLAHDTKSTDEEDAGEVEEQQQQGLLVGRPRVVRASANTAAGTKGDDKLTRKARIMRKMGLVRA